MTGTIDSITRNFDWNGINDLETGLREFEVLGWPKAGIRSDHCSILDNLGRQLSATPTAISNAIELAKGHGDLVILLLEPADSEAYELHSDCLPRTIQYVHAELVGSCRTRDWRNTCILDLRPFRSNIIRKNEDDPTSKDEQAYNATERILEKLQPDVVLICQNGTRQCENDFARSYSSSIDEWGAISLRKLNNAKEVIVVNAFHPMYARYLPDNEPLVARVRSEALRFTFTQAVNILNGRVIRGPGVRKLRDALFGAHHTPHRLTRNGMLDASLDDRFKGVFLSPKATPSFKQLWDAMMEEKAAEVLFVPSESRCSIRLIVYRRLAKQMYSLLW